MKPILLILLLTRLTRANDCSQENDLIFNQDYNQADPPIKPKTKVDVRLLFKTFDEVDDSQMTFTFNSVIDLSWQDDRIRMDPKFTQRRKSRDFGTCIWSPSLTFRGQVSLSHVSNVNNDMEIRIENIGNASIRINFKLHVKVKINCPYFEFRWFPFDRQFCSVVLYSTDTDVDLNGVLDDVYTFHYDKIPLEYDVTNDTLGERDTKVFKENGNPYFGTKLWLDRRLPPYYGYLIFTEMIVVISWITYWVPYASYPGRLGPLVTLLLTLVNTFIKIRGVIPTCMASIPVIEIYVIACIFQILFVILGYAHILIAIQNLKSKVATDGGMDPKVVEEQKVKKINRIYQIMSPVLNVGMWLIIGLYSHFGPQSYLGQLA